MKDNREFIKEVYKKYDDYKKESSIKNKNKKIIKPFKENVGKILGIAASCIIVTSVIVVNSNLKNNKNQIDNKIAKVETSEKITLKTVDNFENFYDIVKENYKTDSKDFILEDSIKYETNKETSSSTDRIETESTQDYSKTNVQVEDVDEADIVKTDGKYIYYIAQNNLVIIDINKKDTMLKIAEINYENQKFNPSEIYIYESKLIVFGNESSYSYRSGITIRETTDSIYKKGIYKQKTAAIIYDLSDIKNPKEERKIEIEGNYVSSRMIGDNIYFVGNKSIYSYDVARYNIKDLNEDYFKPSYTDTIKSSEEKLINFNDIYYFENIENLNYLTLAGFNLKANEEADIKTFLGAGENIYSSTKNMYVVKSKSVYDANTNTYLGRDTKILKFNFENGKINFKAEANIEGAINNQFSMDEYNGYFRIATTIGKTWSMDEDTTNSIYILDDKLKEVGRLDGIAPGEKIYSVRYEKEKAYVVTFKEIDPLFVIDLSNVNNPKILGELKIPGYSTYLHPYDDTHIIGFGYDTKTNSSGTGIQNNGLKMSMFDITDLNNPKELFNVKIGNSNTTSELTDNHKALLFSKEKNLIAFPVRKYENRRYLAKAQIYNIDLEKGFTLKGEILHEGTNYKRFIERIIYSNNVFYTLSKNLIKATDMNTLEEITKLNL